MIWPPVKAWTSKIPIKGKLHFVAINYGSEVSIKWVVLMSVLDSSVVIKIPLSKLADPSRWKSGWDEVNYVKTSKSFNKKNDVGTPDHSHPSIDSGLTIPITTNTIRPWFIKS